MRLLRLCFDYSNLLSIDSFSEEEIGQSARISGSLDDGSEEEGEGEKSRERIHVESSIHKVRNDE